MRRGQTFFQFRAVQVTKVFAVVFRVFRDTMLELPSTAVNARFGVLETRQHFVVLLGSTKVWR